MRLRLVCKGEEEKFRCTCCGVSWWIVWRPHSGCSYLLDHKVTDDVQVAVKMLSPLSAHSYQQFQTEVILLMRVYHGNLTSHVGYLNEKNHFGLIYEYMTKGNLAQVLSCSANYYRRLFSRVNSTRTFNQFMYAHRKSSFLNLGRWTSDYNSYSTR
ncbi:hypothetical protein Csa_015754 [Cucumis sativus]|uniref:Protein kinase domain-containing protein n=1 Tax=Cucumis sativus TaxID=3659 RepID=A0A0A0KB08_CUCSA|nr:hypothetical protein Csa_015754 [Cucumis sativus]